MAGLRESYHQLKSDLVNVKHTLGLAAALPRFFRERVTLQKAEEEIKRLLDTRVERFLELARTQIYERQADGLCLCVSDIWNTDMPVGM
jgi:hypothetical protein